MEACKALGTRTMPCKQTPEGGWGTLVSATTWVWRDRRKTAALSPRTEIDFLSIHSTAQMSSFDNCCVIECAEYWRVSSSGPRICRGCLALWLHYRNPAFAKKFFADSCHAILPLKSRPLIFLWKPRLVLFLLLLLLSLLPLLFRGNYYLMSDQWRLNVNFLMLKGKYALVVSVFGFLNRVKRVKCCRESKKYSNICFIYR